MAPQASGTTDEEVIDYLLTVIMTANTFEPNWSAAAAEHQANTAHNAQRKFKTIVEKSGKYRCTKSVITKQSNTPASVASTSTISLPATPTPAARKSKNTKKRVAPAEEKVDKKRKVATQKTDEDTNVMDDDEQEHGARFIKVEDNEDDDQA